MQHKILVVDDMADVRQDMIRELNPPPTPQEMMTALIAGKPLDFHQRFKVDEASQGEEGVTLALVGGYEAIIMDMRMPPGIDGAEAIRRIRDAGCMTPIVVCTGFSDHSEAALVLANLRPLRILPKPYQPGAVLAAILEVLE